MGKRPGYPTNDEIEKFMDTVIDNLHGRTLLVTLSGGEPTVHPMFARIIEKFKPHGLIGVNSNGSRPLKWWRSLPVLPTGCVFSLHPEYVDKMPHLNELSHFLADAGVDLQYNLVCDPHNWSTVLELYESLDPRFFENILLAPVHDKDKGKNRYMITYTQEQKNWIRKNQLFYNKSKSPFNSYTSVMTFDTGETVPVRNFSETRLKIDGLNRFRDWSCDVGISSINVNFDGEVYTSICKADRLGRIDDFTLLEHPIKCPFESCMRNADIQVDKRAVRQ